MFDTNFLLIIQIAIIGIILVAGMFLIWKSILRLEDKVDRMANQSMAQAIMNGGTSSASASASGSCPLFPSKSFGVNKKYQVDNGKYYGEGEHEEHEEDGKDEENGDDCEDYDDGDDGDDSDDGVNEEEDYDEDEDEDGEDGDEDGDDDFMNDPETLELMKSVFGDPRSGILGLGGADGAAPLIMMFSNGNAAQMPMTTNITSGVVPSVTVEEIQEIQDSNFPAPSVDDPSEAHPVSKSKLKKMTMDQLKEYCTVHQLPIDGTKQQLVDRIYQHVHA